MTTEIKSTTPVLRCKNNGRWTRLIEDLLDGEDWEKYKIIQLAVDRIISRERPGNGYYGLIQWYLCGPMCRDTWHGIASGEIEIVAKISRSVGDLTEHRQGDTMEFFVEII